MKLKEKQWTATRSDGVYHIAHCVDGNLKRYIKLTYAEHYHQFSELLKEAGYRFVDFSDLEAKSIHSV